MDVYKFHKIDGHRILLKDAVGEAVIELPKSNAYLEMFASDIAELESAEKSMEDNSVQVAQKEPEKVSWNDAATRCLIHLYKDNEKTFNDKTARNDEVWKVISNSLSSSGFSFSGEQWQNKFKHLKKLYMKCKDNMGSKATDDSTFDFKFLPEMDEIFAIKPNNAPVATASSSLGSQINCDAVNQSFKEGCKRIAEGQDSVNNKKKKKPSSVILELLQKNVENREERHEDFLAAQKDATQTYERMMNKLIDEI